MNCAGTQIKAVRMRSDGANDLEWADQLVVEFDGWASRFYVAAIDHDEGFRGERFVGASVCVGVSRVTFVGDSDEVGSSFVDDSEGGGVL